MIDRQTDRQTDRVGVGEGKSIGLDHSVPEQHHKSQILIRECDEGGIRARGSGDPVQEP